MQIVSTNFDDCEIIPLRYGRDGENISPALTFSEIPENTQSLALIVHKEDLQDHCPTHWLLYNMSPGTLQIVENELPISGSTGINSFRNMQYSGPSEVDGPHTYIFELIALDTMLDTDTKLDTISFYNHIDSHIIDTATLTGTYGAEME